jgi:tetratricopeptide (TPR) repeat protein
MSRAFYVTRQYDKALEQALSAVETNPTAFGGYCDLGEAYLQKRMYAEAITEIQKALPLSGNTPFVTGLLGYAYAVSGNRAEALKIVGEMKESAKQRYVSAYHVALVYAGLGEKGQALDWLEKAYEEHNEPLIWVGVDPKLDPLRSDPRFVRLLQRLNLPT